MEVTDKMKLMVTRNEFVAMVCMSVVVVTMAYTMMLVIDWMVR